MKHKIERQAAKQQEKKGKAPYAENRKARFDVAVQESYEAGLSLTGPEVKQIRAGRAVLNGAYVKYLLQGAIRRPFLVGLHIPEVAEPDRSRLLLLSRKELAELTTLQEAKGATVVPLDIHTTRGWVKVRIGVGKGRKGADKRALLRERDLTREAQQQIGGRR